MAEENSRAALGDITNRIGKRRTPEKEKDAMDSVDCADVVKRMRFSLLPCTEISSLKQKAICGIPKISNMSSIDVVVDCDGGGGGGDNLDSVCKDSEGVDILAGSSKVLNEGNNSNLLDLGVDDDDVRINDELGDSYAANSSRTGSEAGDDLFGSDTKICQNDVDDHNADDNLILSQSGSVDCTFVTQPLESRELGDENHRTTKLKDDCAYASGSNDLIRSCSCSFCTKAAQLWLDLHHQDIKTRMSAIKRSQKEAIGFVEKRSKVTDRYGTETRVSNLEFQLTHQWRSLYQRMAAIWEEECNQLGVSLLSLTDLREKCKAELEAINANPSEKD